jgi:hypothetical protein
MDTVQAEANATLQTTVEIETLRQLWSTVIPGAAPSPEAIDVWLQRLTFFEIGKCIHATQRLHKKYEGKLKPWQLLTYMEHCVNKALKENYGTKSK